MRGNLKQWAHGSLASAKPSEHLICDVEVNYDAGYKFAFTLVFARGSSGILDEGDLRSPPGRFANMRFFASGGVEWVRSSEPMLTRLWIDLLDPTRLTFATYAGFTPAVPDGRLCVLGLHADRIEITGVEGEGARSLQTSSTVFHATVGLSTGVRKPSEVVRFTGRGGSRSLRTRYH